ncbi:uncharacterized protein OCT59_009601 [Rhizophagus irregularis]|uniref:F-box domain-containing protein n=1 Tax=Rhizophagus irregularis (strain DAOM 197198w) TaxID=1432141 RepID=A0A015L5P4_RHIIW|nr:hypothetical protein RirG_045850 [Rhizophagus irregularis DAOM 197198w]UZO18285.1 hypothetical protein OCT59_009601 [Rhizophagus irregularis]
MTCSKIFSGDLPELTTEIIQYFRNDFSTLYTCILVNRLWCRLAIRLLWENPFSNPTRHNDFINLFLHNLTEDNKTKLNNEYGINNNLFPSNTLFNYPSFIKCLNIQKFLWSIKKWVANIKNLTDKQRYLLSSQYINPNLFKIFINNEVNLHTFEVILNNECCNYFDLSFELIQQNPYFICNIKNFKLCFDENVAKITKFYPFLKFLHSNCNSISSLNINIKLFFYNNNNSDVGITLLSEEHLPKIINSQKNLRKISFEGCINFPLYHSLLSLKNSNCSNTLNTIIFHHINFKDITNILIEVFEQLNVLESIHIIYCSLDSDFVEKIINVTKPFKLKSLFISGNLQIEPIESLLQKSGGYLENFGSGSESNQLFKLIMKYCPKIKYFDLFDLDNCHDNITTAFNLIKNIENTLNYLSIESVDIEFSSIVLQNLGQMLPFKLEYLNLYLMFNNKDFELFLKNSNNIFIKKLSIRNEMQDEDILPYIKKYIMEKKRVKYLAVEVKNKDLFSLKDEVKEFKLYNIEIQNYDKLAIYYCDFIGIY